MHARPPVTPALAAVDGAWQAELLRWFADGDVATFVHREPGGVVRVRLEDVRYSWATPDARGMWGIESRVTQGGRLLEAPRRLDRVGPNVRDLARLGRVLRGRLPKAEDGWQRPEDCERASRTAAERTAAPTGTSDRS